MEQTTDYQIEQLTERNKELMKESKILRTSTMLLTERVTLLLEERATNAGYTSFNSMAEMKRQFQLKTEENEQLREENAKLRQRDIRTLDPQAQYDTVNSRNAEVLAAIEHILVENKALWEENSETGEANSALRRENAALTLEPPLGSLGQQTVLREKILKDIADAKAKWLQ